MPQRHAHDELTETIQKMHAPLLLYARQLVESEAEDLVQEAFLKWIREREEILRQRKSPIENVSAWLFRVVRNEAISRIRRRNLIGRHVENVRTERTAWFESRHETELDAGLVTEKVASLPMELREVLVARLWGGLSFQEIGQLTETSQSTAHRRYNESLQLLKEQISN